MKQLEWNSLKILLLGMNPLMIDYNAVEDKGCKYLSQIHMPDLTILSLSKKEIK